MKTLKIVLNVIKIITVVYPVAKGIILGIIKEYKDNINNIKKIWNSK